MKKIFLVSFLALMVVPMSMRASWEQFVGAAVGGALSALHDYQCRPTAYDIDLVLHDSIREVHYAAVRFAYEDEPLVYNIESVLRGIQREWLSCAADTMRVYHISPAQLKSVYEAMRAMVRVWRYCRPQYHRCYAHELRTIERTLYDAQSILHAAHYETCSCQCDFLWRVTRILDEATCIVRTLR